MYLEDIDHTEVTMDHGDTIDRFTGHTFHTIDTTLLFALVTNQDNLTVGQTLLRTMLLS